MNKLRWFITNFNEVEKLEKKAVKTQVGSRASSSCYMEHNKPWSAETEGHTEKEIWSDGRIIFKTVEVFTVLL